MTGPVAAILLTLIVHVIAFVLLFALCGRGMLDVFRTHPYDGDDWGEPPAGDPETSPPPPGGGLPLPDAEQAPVRLREPGRIGERYPRRTRRPDHEPAPQRTPERA
jgi:hypothetical protein